MANSESVECSDVKNKKKESTLFSRPSRRLVWKTSDLDDKILKMYEHVLEAKKERDMYRKKSKRYFFFHSFTHFDFQTKYTKNS